MSSSKLTLIGLYNYDNTLFDGLTFPAGIEKQLAVDEILLRAGEFETLYPDPAFLKMAITHWGRKHYRTFDKWIGALALEFDPLYNFDRMEEYTDTKSSQGSQNTSETESSTRGIQRSRGEEESESAGRSAQHSRGESGSEETTGNSVSGTGTESGNTAEQKRGVSAYDDSATYQPREKQEDSGSSSGSGTGYAANTSGTNRSGAENEITQEGTNRETGRSENEITQEGTSREGGTQTTTAGVEQTTHRAHLYGNIGVTTSTQLLEDFIRVERFNIYEQIADIFADEFAIMIY